MSKKFGLLNRLYQKLNNHFARIEFVNNQLGKLSSGLVILDAGCGNQQYRKFCSHLIYKSQDFKQYSVSEKKEYGGGIKSDYNYGEQIDYVGDVWNIDVQDASFDAILCTEVFEHIPFPIETVREFARISKPGATLILTAPSNCLRHFDPFFFYSGFSDRWYEKVLPDAGFEIISVEAVGDYNKWMACELARTSKNSGILSKIFLAPAFLYYLCKKQNSESQDTLCFGYHVVAKRV